MHSGLHPASTSPVLKRAEHGKGLALDEASIVLLDGDRFDVA